MEKQIEQKTPVNIALFHPLLNVAFNLLKWKIIGNQHEIAFAKVHNLISMYTNPQTEMFSLKIAGNKDIMEISADKIDALVLSKDKLTIIGDFNGSKTNQENNITLS